MAEIMLPSTLEEVNEELDDLLVQQLELIQDYINLSLENEKQMKDGFFHIARARYNSGSQSISKACFPTEDCEQNFLADVTVTQVVVSNGTSNNCKRQLQISKDSETDGNDVARDESRKSMASQFGILKSPSLKVAEARFHSCLNQVIDRTNTLNDLENVYEKYSTLLQHKKQLEMSNDRET